MGVYSELGNARDFGSLGAIPKSDAAFKILQDDKYNDMGDISWSTGETWGVLISGCVVGVATVLLLVIPVVSPAVKEETATDERAVATDDEPEDELV